VRFQVELGLAVADTPFDPAAECAVPHPANPPRHGGRLGAMTPLPLRVLWITTMCTSSARLAAAQAPPTGAESKAWLAASGSDTPVRRGLIEFLGPPAIHEPSVRAAAAEPELDTDLALLAALPRTSIASADTDQDADAYYSNIYRKFSLSLGWAAYANFDTSIKVDSSTAVGATLDLEDVLGLDSSKGVVRLDGQYSFSRRHRVDFSYFDIERDGSRVTTDPIQIGDVTIPAGQVDTEFDTQIVRLAYRYNFVADERTALGLSAGLHVMGIKLAANSPGGSVEGEFKVAAPLPLLGLHWTYALSRKWSLLTSLEVLRFDIGPYRGYVGDNRLTVEHELFEHIGWGIGLNNFTVDGHFEGQDDQTASLEYGYSGLMIYLRGFF